MISDNIILRAKKKDRDAFEVIYNEFKDFVWNVAVKITGNQTLAEDVAAEVFIKVFDKIKKFKFKSSFKTWIYRVTVNTTLNYIDKEKRRAVKQVNEDYLKEESNVAEYTVKELLHHLEKKEKMIIILREVEGLTYGEIADAMNISLAAVKTKIYRIRNKLRKNYELSSFR